MPQIKKLFALLCLVPLLSTCTNEYFEYHQQAQSLKQDLLETENNAKKWSPENISSEEIELLDTPNTSTLDVLVSKINESKSRVYLEVYMLTEKRIIQALKDAISRKVDVQVILEKNVFGNPYMNAKTYKTLQENSIPVTWASPEHFVFTHAKFLVVDDEYVVWTANYAHAAFVSNREFFVIGHEPSILKTLESLFLADAAQKSIAISHPDLLIAPLDARKKLTALIASAKNQILLYSETFDDPEIISLLEQKIKSGVEVTCILANPEKLSANKESIQKLKSIGVYISAPKKPIIHAKALIVDGTFAYIWSANFTKNSLENNREIGIFTRDTAIISTVLQDAKKDAP